jgi:hypothetical protein
MDLNQTLVVNGLSGSPARHTALRVGSVLAACALLTGVPVAKADTITLYDTLNAYSYGPGNGNYAGELTAYTDPSFLGNGYVSSTEQSIPSSAPSGAGTGFETFCASASVGFTAGTAYNFTLANSDSQGHALSLGAAWLYDEFATGALSGYNYTNGGIRNTDAGLVQAAIWCFLGGQPQSGWPPPGHSISNDPFYVDAITNFGSLSGADAANNGTYPVDFLVLTDSSGDPIQNQLVLTPQAIPETTTLTLTLLGVALTTLGFAGRKLRSK